MKAKHHFWSSLAVGGVLYFVTDSWSAAIGTMLGGFVIDADHIVDQFWSIYEGARPLTKRAAQEAEQQGLRGFLARYFRRRKLIRLPLLLHAYEWLTALLVITLIVRTPFVIGLLAGYALHLGLDMWRHYREFR